MVTLTPAQRLRGRSILTMLDMSPAEVADLLLVGERLKGERLREQVPLLRGRTLGMLFERQTHCRMVPVNAIVKVSGRVSVVTQINTKTKFTDIVPVMPGRETLNPDARFAIRK